MHSSVLTILLIFAGSSAVKSQGTPIFGTMTVCTESNFGGVCHNQIIATPTSFCNNLSMSPRSARPWANTYCWLFTGPNCSGSYTEVNWRGEPFLDRVYITTHCNILNGTSSANNGSP